MLTLYRKRSDDVTGAAALALNTSKIIIFFLLVLGYDILAFCMHCIMPRHKKMDEGILIQKMFILKDTHTTISFQNYEKIEERAQFLTPMVNRRAHHLVENLKLLKGVISVV
jgi:hypothetical protein